MSAVLVLLLATANVFAQMDTLQREPTPGPAPVLDGHLFQPMVGVASPFLITTTHVNVSAGQTLNLELPILTIGEKIVIAPKGDLLIVGMAAGHEQRIKDWLSVFGTFRLLGRLGTNVSSLLSQGVNTIGAFTLGWKVKAIETRDLMTSVSLDLTNGSVTTVDMERFLSGVIDSNGVVATNPLLDTKPSLTAGLNARAAYAFNRTFGATGFIGAVYGESSVRGGEADIYFDAGFTFNTDLRPSTDVPLAITLGYGYRETPSVEDAAQSQSVSTGGLRFSYSGTEHFALGLQINGQFAEIEGASTAFFIGAGLDMRFYY
jgi:hypothetical protein